MATYEMLSFIFQKKKFAVIMSKNLNKDLNLFRPKFFKKAFRAAPPSAASLFSLFLDEKSLSNLNEN